MTDQRAERLLFVQFLLERGYLNLDERRRGLKVEKKIDDAFIHYEELNDSDASAEVDHKGPVKFKVTVDQQLEADVFDFSITSRITMTLREIAFSLNRAEFEKLIVDLTNLRNSLDALRLEKEKTSMLHKEEFERWKKARKKTE